MIVHQIFGNIFRKFNRSVIYLSNHKLINNVSTECNNRKSFGSFHSDDVVCHFIYYLIHANNENKDQLVQLSTEEYSVPEVYQSVKNNTDEFIRLALRDRESLDYGANMKKAFFNIDKGNVLRL